MSKGGKRKTERGSAVDPKDYIMIPKSALGNKKRRRRNHRNTHPMPWNPYFPPYHQNMYTPYPQNTLPPSPFMYPLSPPMTPLTNAQYGYGGYPTNNNNYQQSDFYDCEDHFQDTLDYCQEPSENVEMHVERKYSGNPSRELSELEYNKKLQEEYDLDYLRRVRELESLRQADEDLLREIRRDTINEINPVRKPVFKKASEIPRDKDTNSGKDTDTPKPVSLYLPLKTDKKDTGPLQKPETTDGIFQLLFPQIKSDAKKPVKEEPSKRKDRSKFVEGKPMDISLETLDDLLDLSSKIGKEFKVEDNYALDLESLQKMTPCLKKLKSMIGLTDIKDKIVHQVLFFLQGLDETNKDMLHTVIEGDPGVGKTEIAKILGEIYGSLGILSKGTFTSVKRADLVGSYLGQTASKTLKVLEEAKGGVLFIDEAYSLGNEEGKDIYSKECIDTITAYLSENREDFVCIIAGYKKALRECFFKYNAGLERRFPWTYTIKSYTPEELKLILEKMVNDSSWRIEAEVDFFKEHKDKFKHYGGDMENLFHKSKLAHSMRAIRLDPKEKKIVTMKDLEGGMKLFLEEEEEKKENISFHGMYT